MEYLDFTLRIGARSGGGYDLLVMDPSSRRESHEAIGPELAAQLLQATLQFAASARTTRAIVAEAGPVAVAEPTAQSTRDLGAELFHALVFDDVYASYRDAMETAQRDNKGVRLRLRFDAPELDAIPWEFIFDPKIRNEHLGLSVATPIVRHLELPTDAGRLTLDPPVRILGMVGAGEGIDVNREKANMQLAVEHLIEKGVVALDWVDGNGWQDLQRTVRRREIANIDTHVFHFIGHGGVDPASGEGVVYVRESGGIFTLRASDLASHLGSPLPRLIVLNSCEGARPAGSGPNSSTGATLASRGAGAVISMQYVITEKAAQQFSATFYEALADGAPVDFSLAEARKSIRTSVSEWEWATPVLHMRAANGELFEVDLARALFPKTAPPPPAPPAATPSPVVAPTAAADEGLDLLADAVRAVWIDGRLAQAMSRAQHFDIGIQAAVDAVRSPFATIAAAPTSVTSLGGERAMLSLFDDMGGSLLVLGEPGAGKTIALLELARDLLAARDADPSRPVPVVFTLSSWAQHNGAIDDWMASELSAHYRIPRVAARAWIKDLRVLPLLDGLDEVAADRRAKCATAIDTFSRAFPTSAVVVCSRLKEYLELPVRLGLNGAIRLQPMAEADVLAVVARAGDRLAGLNALLRSDPALLRDARSPLMLSLMTEGFDGVSAADAANVAGGDVAARRQKVMDQYVARAFARVRASGQLGG